MVNTYRLVGLVWLVGGITIALHLCYYFKYKRDVKRGDALQPVESHPDTPYQYPEIVDLRIIVMTFNRPKSLKETLKSLNRLDMDGDTGLLEIWIDANEHRNDIDKEEAVANTIRTARTFSWRRGRTRVHVRQKHVGIYGQWIDTWRPRTESRELALLLEDDISVSPHAYRWLKAVHGKYGSRNDIAGYTLQREHVNAASNGKPIVRPRDRIVFLYRLLGSWGYAPHPKSWIDFQTWYHEVRKNATFRPYVPKAARITKWYKNLEKTNREHTMWTMWHVYYCQKANMFTVYSNLKASSKKSQILLAANRNEPGLHFRAKLPDNRRNILTVWSDEYIDLPDQPPIYDFDGSLIAE